MALKKSSTQGKVNVSMAAIAAITANAATSIVFQSSGILIFISVPFMDLDVLNISIHFFKI